MDFGDFVGSFFGGKENPKLNALIDSNHKLTLIHASMLESYTQQVEDLKQRLALVEQFLKEKFKDAE